MDTSCTNCHEIPAWDFEASETAHQVSTDDEVVTMWNGWVRGSKWTEDLRWNEWNQTWNFDVFEFIAVSEADIPEREIPMSGAIGLGKNTKFLDILYDMNFILVKEFSIIFDLYGSFLTPDITFGKHRDDEDYEKLNWIDLVEYENFWAIKIDKMSTLGIEFEVEEWPLGVISTDEYEYKFPPDLYESYVEWVQEVARSTGEDCRIHEELGLQCTIQNTE